MNIKDLKGNKVEYIFGATKDYFFLKNLDVSKINFLKLNGLTNELTKYRYSDIECRFPKDRPESINAYFAIHKKLKIYFR